MHSQIMRVPEDARHYLELELEGLVQDKQIWHFLRARSHDGMWYWDLENPDHEWISPEFWELLGIDPATKPHCPSAWQELIHPSDLKVAAKNFREHCADPRHPYDQVVRYPHADGSTVWVRCRGLAIRRKGGVPIRMLCTLNDVTSRKNAEGATDDVHKMTGQADEDLRAFTYSTSHDLKSPANTIRMLLSEARRALKTGDAQDAEQMLQKAETTNEAMRTMVDKLLDYTRMSGSKFPHAPINLDQLMHEVIETLAADIRQTSAKIEIGKLGIAVGCEWQLRQMFQNFISNGIKFQPNGRSARIEITATLTDAGLLKVAVADDGIGIDSENHSRIFDLFARLHLPSAYAGSGVGLAFCARVARSHGSEIDVHSEPGQGTVFSVCLPTSMDACT